MSGRPVHPTYQHSLQHRLLSPKTTCQPLRSSRVHVRCPFHEQSVKWTSVLSMCTYKLICMYINPTGKIPGVCSLKEDSNSPFLAIPQRGLGLYTQNGKDTKTGCKTCQVLTSHLFETRKRWSLLRQSRRRHF